MADTPPPSPEPPEEPANLKFLRLLVTILTATMIIGLVVIVTLIVIRYRDQSAPLPDSITLPSGAVATAYTQGRDWYAVVTEDAQPGEGQLVGAAEVGGGIHAGHSPW